MINWLGGNKRFKDEVNFDFRRVEGEISFSEEWELINSWVDVVLENNLEEELWDSI